VGTQVKVEVEVEVSEEPVPGGWHPTSTPGTKEPIQQHSSFFMVNAMRDNWCGRRHKKRTSPLLMGFSWMGAGQRW
jgi:hypothetical protein